MNCLPCVFFLLSLLHTGFTSLPAPVNVSVDSLNFHHVLRWDPGPGTPPGTQYQYCRWGSKLTTTNRTSVKLKLQHFREQYVLAVRAFYNRTLFSEYRKRTFTPYGDTTIGPPTLSLAGCGNCIRVNVSLPEPAKNKEMTDLYSAFRPSYQVSWKKRDGKPQNLVPQKTKSFTIPHLERGTEYCVQVLPQITVNKNTKPSAWECVFTSAPEPSRAPVVLGAVITPLVFVFVALMTIMLLLYYTGFICKLKATLPRVLNAALSRSYTLTPEKTIPDCIHISPDVKKQRKHNDPTMPQPAARGRNLEEDDEEEDEEEENEGMNIYVNRPTGLSSGQTSCEDSGDVAGNQTPAASGNSGSLTVKEEEEEEEEEEAPVAEFEDTHDENKAKNDVTELFLIPFNPGRQTGVQSRVLDEVVEQKVGQEEEVKKKKKEEEVKKKEEEEEQGSSSGNINLFSVTLGALAGCEEEEEHDIRHSLTDFLKLCDQEPLLPTNSLTEDQTDVQTAALMLPTHADFTDAGYEGRQADTCSNCEKPDEEEEEEEEEDEEEEEEFSGYMKHT